jgi:hypothetical protein
MSAPTVQAIEDAILAHHRATTDQDRPERAGAVITGWVVAYEFSNLVDVPGEASPVIGYQNEYIASDHSPNLHAGLTSWANDILRAEVIDTYGGDGDDD